MEEQTQVNVNNSTDAKNGAGKKLALFGIGILLLLGLGAAGWYILSEPPGELENTEEAVPTLNLEPTESPTPTPEEVEKADIRISVLNGTGIAGAAGALKTELENLDYEQIETGNADETGVTTTAVTFNDSVPEAVRSEIIETLEEIYRSVTDETGSVTGADIEIIVGLRKNQTAATATPTKSATSPTPTKAAVTVTSTVTPTPTSTN